MFLRYTLKLLGLEWRVNAQPFSGAEFYVLVLWLSCSLQAQGFYNVVLLTVILSVHSNSVAGESSLDRLACGLGGKTVLPHIIVTVPQMLQNGRF